MVKKKLNQLEFESFVDKVLNKRIADPEPSLLTIIKSVNDSLPEDKRRYITGNHHVRDEIAEVKRRLVPKTPRDEILNELKSIRELLLRNS